MAACKRHTPAAACLVASLWAAAPMGCQRHVPPPRAGRGAAAAGDVIDASPQHASQPVPILLTPTDLQLPLPPPEANSSERQFFGAAIRAVRHTYEDDIDDPSQLLALQQRLGRDPRLAAVRGVWQEILATSLSRAATLRVLGPTLRALRQAVASTWRDDLQRTYRDVDAASCRIAQQHMPQETGATQMPRHDTVITVEPLGTYPLHVLLRFCDDPKSLYNHE